MHRFKVEKPGKSVPNADEEAEAEVSPEGEEALSFDDEEDSEFIEKGQRAARRRKGLCPSTLAPAAHRLARNSHLP